MIIGIAVSYKGQVSMEKSSENNGFLYDASFGLIGHNFITPTQAQRIRHTLQTRVLPRLQAKYPHHRISLLTPLAPGSDYLLARELGDWLAARSIPCRLQVVQTLPLATMVDEYQPAWDKGGSWDGEDTPTGQHWDAQKHLILQGLEHLIQRDPAHNSIIRLPPATNPACLPRNQPAFQQAARWIVDHADELLVVNDPSRPAGGPGGTQETLGWWRAKDPDGQHLTTIDPTV